MYPAEAYRYNTLTDNQLHEVPRFCRTRPDVMALIAEIAEKQGYKGDFVPAEQMYGRDALKKLVPFDEFIDWYTDVKYGLI